MSQRNLFLHIISRKTAKDLGLKRYFTGKLCSRGHISYRQVSKSTCLECKRISSRESRAEGKPDYKRIAIENSIKSGLPLVSRKDAMLYGDIHYFTGMPCNRGHLAKRSVSGFSCVVCARENATEWRKKNPGLAIETQRRFRAGNSHSEYMSKGSTKARRRRQNTERKRNIKNAIPLWESPLNITAYYEVAISDELTVDHVIPIKSDFVCGLHCCDNFQMLNVSDNSKKGNRCWPDMPDTKDNELLKIILEFKTNEPV